jgi:Holliday junction resolvase RusA-like endonuclease
MSHLTITVAGTPRGKQRARASGFGGRVRVYTPPETVNAEAFAKLCAIQQIGQPVLQGPLVVTIEAVCPMPKMSRKKTAEALAGAVRPTGKPDLDNIAKLYCDAFNKVVWGDDSQIVALTMSKRYGTEPQTIITVKQMAIEAAA